MSIDGSQDGTPASAQEAITVDFSLAFQKSVAFVKQHYIILLLLIPLFISIWFRVQPAFLPSAEDSARENVENIVRSAIEQSIAAQYPQLPPENRKNLIDEAFERVKKDGTFTLNGQVHNLNDLVAQATEQLKASFQDDTGHTYLAEIDPYYFTRRARNYLDHGFELDKEIDGKYYDTKALGGVPLEKNMPTTRKMGQFHTLVQVILYKIMNVFSPTSLMKASFYVPIIISALAVFPAFFIAKKIAGAFAGFFAAWIVAMHPSFLLRTVGGFSDTDGYNVVMPLFIMWFFLEALETTDLRKTTLFAVLAGLTTGFFAFTWGGWWFIFDFVVLVFLAFFVYELMKILVEYVKQRRVTPKESGKDIKKDLKFSLNILKPALLCFIVYLVVSAVFVGILRTPTGVIDAISEPLKFAAVKEVGTTKIWPNVLTTVAEFNEVGFNDLVREVSFDRILLLFFALLGLLFTLLQTGSFEAFEQRQLSFALMYLFVLILFLLPLNTFFFIALSCIPVLYVLIFEKKTSKTALFLISSFSLYSILLRILPFLNNKVLLTLFLIFLPLLIAIVYTLFDKREIDIKASLLMSLWFCATLFASTKGIRFLLLFVPAFALASGIGIGKIVDLLSSFFTSLLSVKKSYIFPLFAAAALLLLLSPTLASYNAAQKQYPLINDQWWNALAKIRDNSSPDAIITSWWDFGHWFKFVADRAVTFDGGSQDSPMAHWVGKALLTSDEKEALGILRMLDCGSTLAYDTLFSATGDDIGSIQLLYKIFPLSRDEAKKVLQQQPLSSPVVDDVLKYTHCDPPEGYVITSGDMVGKAGVWAHFGSWDFTKAKTVNVVNNYPREEALRQIKALGYDDSKADALYTEVKNLGVTSSANSWIAPWPNYYTGPNGCQKAEDTLVCGNGVVFNTTSSEMVVYTQERVLKPTVYAIVQKNTFALVEQESDDTTGIAVSLLPGQNEGEAPTAVLHQVPLTGSMFNRLFHYRGLGLKCFDFFEYQKTVTATEIYVWKIDWTCS